MCVCVCVCVCVCMRLEVRIVSRENILCFENTCIIIIILCSVFKWWQLDMWVFVVVVFLAARGILLCCMLK